MNKQHHRQIALVVSVSLAGLLAISLAVGSQLMAQTSDVVYKVCYVEESSRVQRHPSCGIDSAGASSSSSSSSKSDKTCLNASGKVTTDRSQCDFEKTQQQTPGHRTEPLNEQQQNQVIDTLDEQFGTEQRLQLQQSLTTAASTAIDRLQLILSNDSLNLTANSRGDILGLVESLSELQSKLTAVPTYRELKVVRKELGLVMMEVSEVVTQVRQNAAQNGEVLESLVTRIDGLVTQVGTVIRQLELEGQDVPKEIQSGHTRAKRLITEAKRSCSMRRPQGCGLLHRVLEELSRLQEPFCRIESKAVTFCG